MKKKTVLVFTGGGLAPALNSTLYGVINAAQKNNIKILGGMFGWASLLNGGKIIDLSKTDINSIKNIGGTFLRSSRSHPLTHKNGLKQVKKQIKKYNIDHLIAIGGNDTMGAAYKLSQKGIPIIGIPKTIDNDLSETYWTPGFPSAAHYLANFAMEIKKDAAYALSRIYIIESLGQDAGWLTAAASYGHADVIIPPEKEVDLNKVLKAIKTKYKDNGNYATVVIAQEAKFKQKLNRLDNDQVDHYKTKRSSYICLALREEIKKYIKDVTVKALYPGNYLQSGYPIDIDKKTAIKLGNKAIELVKKEKSGKMTCLIKKGNKIKISNTDLNIAIKLKIMPDDYFDWELFRVTRKYLDYMKPILGKYKRISQDPYYKLIKKVNK
jgi:ATP-dependent phosphofructokinase / diphosphate-dependent phosphofructokinase